MNNNLTFAYNKVAVQSDWFPDLEIAGTMVFDVEFARLRAKIR